MRRGAPPSRLRLAWTLLGLGIAALLLAAILVPAPRPGGTMVAFDLPAEPDRYAPSGGDDADLPATGLPVLPQVVRGDPEGLFSSSSEPEEGEVIITLPHAAPAPGERGAVAIVVPPSPPITALQTETEYGPMPFRSEGQTPFAAYRRLRAPGDGPMVAVVLSGLGLDTGLSQAAFELPADVSLGFAPYAKGLPDMIDAATKAGHEVLIELPMSTPGVAPAVLGPAGLLADRSPDANAKRLDWLLSRAPAYPMVTNYLGAGFSRDQAAIDPVLRRLSSSGLAYLDDTGLAAELARGVGLPYVAADQVVPPDGDAGAVLDKAEATAKRDGRVVVVKLYATDRSVAELAAWSRRTKAMLVPVSTAVSAS